MRDILVEINKKRISLLFIIALLDYNLHEYDSLYFQHITLVPLLHTPHTEAIGSIVSIFLPFPLKVTDICRGGFSIASLNRGFLCVLSPSPFWSLLDIFDIFIMLLDNPLRCTFN